MKYPFENGLVDLPMENRFECLYYFVQNLIKKEKRRVEAPDKPEGAVLLHFLVNCREIPYSLQ